MIAELLHFRVVGIKCRDSRLVRRLLWRGLRDWVGFVGVFALLDSFDDTNGVPFCVAEFGLDLLVWFTPDVEQLEERGRGEEGIRCLSCKPLELSAQL